MRWHEIASGLRLPVFGEEQAVLTRVEAAEHGLDPATLDERDREVARQMVSRGLLRRVRGPEGKSVLKASSARDIWSDR